MPLSDLQTMFCYLPASHQSCPMQLPSHQSRHKSTWRLAEQTQKSGKCSGPHWSPEKAWGTLCRLLSLCRHTRRPPVKMLSSLSQSSSGQFEFHVEFSEFLLMEMLNPIPSPLHFLCVLGEWACEGLLSKRQQGLQTFTAPLSL